MASYADYYGVVLPAEAEVASGVDYGWAGTEFTGTLSGGGGGPGDALEATSQEILAIVELIKAKTDLIVAGSVTVQSMVATNGRITGVVFINDDYLSANGRGFSWTLSEVAGFTAASVAVRFLGRAVLPCGEYTFAVTTGSVTDNGDGTWTVASDLPAASSAPCAPGDYDWAVELSEGGVLVTRIANDPDVPSTRMRLREKPE